MKKRPRRKQEEVYPVTADDWHAGRHEEDPAELRNPTDVRAALEQQFIVPEQTLSTRDIYRRR